MRARTRRLDRRRQDRGAAAVEFALVVPILLLVVIGIFNFGFLFAQQIALNNGARQAARFAVVDGRDCGAIQAEGMSAAETIGMGPSQVPTPVITRNGGSAPCSMPCTGSTPGDNIEVTMTRAGGDNDWVVSFPPFNAMPVPDLVGQGTMRCEFS